MKIMLTLDEHFFTNCGDQMKKLALDEHFLQIVGPNERLHHLEVCSLTRRANKDFLLLNN